MKKIKDIINEEFDIMATEGVADTYGEKFGLPNQAKDMDKVALSGIKPDDSMGEFIGSFMGDSKKINVYCNPKSLNNFDAHVRAVSNADGDLFVSQADDAFYHSEIGQVVNDQGKYKIPITYNGNYAVTWHRINKTNEFGYSVSYMDFFSEQPNKPIAEKFIEAVRRKNPNFKFTQRYWQTLEYPEFSSDF